MNVDTQIHLTALRGLLVFQRDELRADLHALQIERARQLADIGAFPPDDRKAADAFAQDSDVSPGTQERLHRELAQCEAALQRLDEERYGDCVDCGEPIAWPRLLAQPAAERCAACQRAFERAGDPD